MQGKKVLLSVTGLVQQAGEEEADDEIRLVTTGELNGSDDSWRLNYTESQPEDDSKHDVTITMKDGVVTMDRRGEYNTSMVFSKGNRFEGSYNTPFGALDMGVYPTQVKYHVDGGRGEVLLQYQLDIQGQFASMREMRIRFAPSCRS